MVQVGIWVRLCWARATAADVVLALVQGTPPGPTRRRWRQRRRSLRSRMHSVPSHPSTPEKVPKTPTPLHRPPLAARTRMKLATHEIPQNRLLFLLPKTYYTSFNLFPNGCIFQTNPLWDTSDPLRLLRTINNRRLCNCPFCMWSRGNRRILASDAFLACLLALVPPFLLAARGAAPFWYHTSIHNSGALPPGPFFAYLRVRKSLEHFSSPGRGSESRSIDRGGRDGVCCFCAGFSSTSRIGFPPQRDTVLIDARSAID